MVYQISATKLQTYHRCAYSYYLRYERKLPTSEFFGSAVLGTALHHALAQCHRDWHYYDAVPDVRWFKRCWEEHSANLTPKQNDEGLEILENYHRTFIASEPVLRRPLAVEGTIHGSLQVENVEFLITGRYDRLDFLPDGLELIDYKSGRDIKTLDDAEMDIQMGLYYLALEQTYGQSLKYMSLLYLRLGEKVQLAATREQKDQATAMIGNLAVRLRYDRGWEPNPGDHCDRCSFSRYCPAVSAEPTPLPASRNKSQLQLALTL